MKKILLSLAAIALSASVSAQVAAFEVEASRVMEHAPELLTLPTGAAQTMKAPAKATLAKNQKYIGHDMDDTVPTSGYGFTAAAGQTLKPGADITRSMLSQYVGCRIIGMRFALCQAVGKSAVDVMRIKKNGNTTSAMLTDTVETTVAGWNEVRFATPYTITDTDSFKISYSYVQTNVSSTAYPIAVSGTTEAGGLYVYGTLNSYYGEGWYGISNAKGNAMIQLLIESDKDFEPYDLALTDASTAKYVKYDAGSATLTFDVKNYGTTSATAATFGVSVDGTEYSTVDIASSDGISIGSTWLTLSGKVSLPKSLTIGTHDIKFYVKKVMGAAPTGDLSNDTVACSFRAVSETKTHQKQLVEHFTSQYCTYCPLGYDILNQLTTDRSDIAWVSIHGTGNFKDVYTVDNSVYIQAYSITGYPSANFNRYRIPGASSLAGTLSYKSAYTQAAAKMYSSYIDESCEDMPAFADVDITTAYDATTSKLSIKVSGETVSDFNTVYGDDAVLTVYLTEDSLYARQLNMGTWVSSYLHNNVLRKIVSAPLGDAITVSNSKYENNYEVTLDAAWKPANMHVVAFISRPIKYSVSSTGSISFTTPITDAGVTNCNSVKISGADGIQNAITDAADNTIVARYTLDGRQISAPQKGINIVKTASGKTMKVMVR